MAFLQLAGCSMQGGVPDPEDVVSNRKLFSTAYLLVSALAGMEKRAETQLPWSRFAYFVEDVVH